MNRQRIRIGDLLVEKGLISKEQLESALESQKRTGGKLGQTIIDLGYLEEEKLLEAVAAQIDVPFVDLRHFPLNQGLIKKIPEVQARRFRVIALDDKGSYVLLGMQEPLDIFAIDSVEAILGKKVKPVLIQESALLRSFNSFYDNAGELSQYAEELSIELSDPNDNPFDIEPGDEDAPVVRLLESMFEQAVKAHASDIHIEPGEKTLVIRTRIDGQLQEQIINEKQIVGALTQRLKLMAGLNIAEKRLPQDGRFQIKVEGMPLDVRVSTMPISYGESVVMRLLPQAHNAWDLEKAGMPKQVLEIFRELIHRPHGMILVTGPTGSGKTSTLYGALRELNKAEKKIITVEDPVEYRMGRVCQVQVNTKIDLTFARVLRATLRQDPDILMVGEIRDVESASIAMRAAMTGHLVLATLHTTDASSSALRLIDMGVPPYLVAIALRGILAQRLVRCICTKCKQPYVLNNREQIWLNNTVSEERAAQMKFSVGRGCAHCNNTGYAGRMGVYELLEINTKMMDALRTGDHTAFDRLVKSNPDHATLGKAALDVATQGLTTLDEVIAVAEFLDE